MSYLNFSALFRKCDPWLVRTLLPLRCFVVLKHLCKVITGDVPISFSDRQYSGLPALFHKVMNLYDNNSHLFFFLLEFFILKGKKNYKSWFVPLFITCHYKHTFIHTDPHTHSSYSILHLFLIATLKYSPPTIFFILIKLFHSQT